MTNRGQKRVVEAVEKSPRGKRRRTFLSESRLSSSNSSNQTLMSSSLETHEGSSNVSTSTQSRGGGESDGEENMFEELMSSLEEEEDESKQIALLTTLCETLPFCDITSLSGTFVDSLCPVLVSLVGHEGNANIILMAIRAITYLCDIDPVCACFLVQHDAIPALCKKLVNIEYMDVAEQCLLALEKISSEEPVHCLQSDVIMAVLNHFDFFPASKKRVGLSIIVNVCNKLPSESSSHIIGAVPILCNLLQYEDGQLIESVVTCLTKMVKRVCSSDMLDEMYKHGVVQNAIRLIGGSTQTMVSPKTSIDLIRLLAKLAADSTAAFRTLFQLNITGAVKHVLSAPDAFQATQSTMSSDGKSLMHEILKFLDDALLPAITGKRHAKEKPDKEVFLDENPDIMKRLGCDIFPVLIREATSGVNMHISAVCLSIINKLIHFSTSDVVQNLLQSVEFPSFLAGIFTKKDHQVIVFGLHVVESTMYKLPHIYRGPFIKSGVVFAIHALLCTNADHTRSPLFYCIKMETGSTTQGERIRCLARHALNRYFGPKSLSPKAGVTDALQKLRSLSDSLIAQVSKSVEAGILIDQEEAYALLHQIISELSKKNSVSTFEFVESGIMKALVCYLSNGKCLSGLKDVDAMNLAQIMGNKLEIFGRLLFSFYENPAQEESPLLTLVRILQSSLSSLESFLVISSCMARKTTSYAVLPHGRDTSYPSLKVQFLRDEGQKASLHDYGKAIVRVDPFVPVNEIERHLWGKVSKDESHRAPKNDKDATLAKTDSHDQEAIAETDGGLEVNSIVSGVKNTPKKLLFSLDGKQLSNDLTLYQSLIQKNTENGHDCEQTSDIWNRVYKIVYQTGELSQKRNFNLCYNGSLPFSSARTSSFFQDPVFFSEMFQSAVNFENLGLTWDALFLLKSLEAINKCGLHLMSCHSAPTYAVGSMCELNTQVAQNNLVPANEFVNKKLTQKLEQLLGDPMVISTGAVPTWCNNLIVWCPFLFDFEARCKYFHLPSTGSSSISEGTMPVRHPGDGRIPRGKILVRRNKVLEAASRMMKSYATYHRVLPEVQFYNEVGTGIGPKLEFYTLICQEFQDAELCMWRDVQSATVGEGSSSPYGLFPRPWSSSQSKSSKKSFAGVVKNFTLLGQIVAKALEDRQILHLPFSKAFYKLILGKELNMYDIFSFDPTLGKGLLFLLDIVRMKNDSKSSHDEKTECVDVNFLSKTVEELYLDFSLPGYPSYHLVDDSDSRMVNLDNVEEYVSLVVQETVKSGIAEQVEAFKSGFNQVFHVGHLKVFSEEELESLLCGEDVAWNSDNLLDHTKFDHGYTASSPPVLKLLEILSEFDQPAQTAFLRFVTGAPRLPTGGLASLNPKLTIVRKHCSAGIDDELPSVMTCANYLKLPPYSSKEVMKKKLLYAITEGQGAFHLS